MGSLELPCPHRDVHDGRKQGEHRGDSGLGELVNLTVIYAGEMPSLNGLQIRPPRAAPMCNGLARSSRSAGPGPMDAGAGWPAAPIFIGVAGDARSDASHTAL